MSVVLQWSTKSDRFTVHHKIPLRDVYIMRFDSSPHCSFENILCRSSRCDSFRRCLVSAGSTCSLGVECFTNMAAALVFESWSVYFSLFFLATVSVRARIEKFYRTRRAVRSGKIPSALKTKALLRGAIVNRTYGMDKNLYI